MTDRKPERLAMTVSDPAFHARSSGRVKGGRGMIRRFALCALGNTGIALFLTGIGVGGGFIANFVFAQCIGLTIAASQEAVQPRLSHRGWSVRLAATAGLVILGSLLGAVVAGALIGIPGPIDSWPAAVYGRATLIGLVFGGIIVGFVLIREQLHRTQAGLRDEQLRRARAQAAEAEAELRLLRAQVEPHFLFNSLAHVASLIDAEPTRARDVLDRLIAYLRGALNHSRCAGVTLADEIDVVTSYLDVMRERLGDRLAYRVAVPDTVRRVSVPPMLLQPLVENAVKHGIEPKVGGGTIRIRGRWRDDALVLDVEDDGGGPVSGAPGEGAGLANLRARLEGVYGEAVSLMLLEGGEGGTIARVTVPADAMGKTERVE